MTTTKLPAELEEKQAIPLVAAQMQLILALQTENWWQDVTLPMLEDVRARLRELIKFVDKKPATMKPTPIFMRRWM